MGDPVPPLGDPASGPSEGAGIPSGDRAPFGGIRHPDPLRGPASPQGTVPPGG